MSMLAIIEALRHRLMGGAHEEAPDLRALLRAWSGETVGNIGVEGDAVVNTWLRRTTTGMLDKVGMSVPVHWKGPEGKPTERVYPSLTYDVISHKPRFDDGAIGGSVRRHVPTSYGYVTLTNDDGEDEEVWAPRMGTVVPRAVPMDTLVEIRAYAREPVVMAILHSHVIKCFPPRTYLTVPRLDGTAEKWDMWHTGYQDLDKREAVYRGAPGVEREYAVAWTLNVEGYEDNSEMEKLVAYVDTRRFTVGNAP